MSTKLSEMFRRYYCDESGCIGHYVELLPSELVAALIAEGGEIREVSNELVAVLAGEELYALTDIRVDEPGRYLVFPIPVESAEAKET